MDYLESDIHCDTEKWVRNKEHLIDSLRTEANNVKDCFTRFSFHCLALSGVILGYIIKEQPGSKEPYFALAGLLISLINLAVARIGTYKYGTANRHFGFELYIHRMMDHPYELKKLCTYIDIGWEEAMRAWRIVQASIYSCIYETDCFWGIGKDKPIDKHIQYKWYNVNVSLSENSYNAYRNNKIVRYYSGSYLREMHKILHLIAYLGLVPMLYASYQFSLSNHLFHSLFFWVISLAGFVLIKHKVNHNDRRRKILEDGLLSIHACSIVWQAVVVAHLKTKEEIEKQNMNTCGHPLKNYSTVLGEWTGGICENISEIHSWMINPVKAQNNDCGNA
ncbi:hypothetical protein DSCO28_01780 [Desulfosarcina ovata subsp. sediminis]|uniref:Uncharacterized protein n=1 Tax=Desulfosarcina ovata subsp. sediminis TaxID=885957 RepID=A0A5K7ZCB2_9BACT|nr:hypothetical protein [Desulfosarcina ovata]BBO79612.1 hypothetical protein DSCO28_01780 [Desulfosarcina ovata subsp. sediminis]